MTLQLPVAFMLIVLMALQLPVAFILVVLMALQLPVTFMLIVLMALQLPVAFILIVLMALQLPVTFMLIILMALQLPVALMLVVLMALQLPVALTMLEVFMTLKMLRVRMIVRMRMWFISLYPPTSMLFQMLFSSPVVPVPFNLIVVHAFVVPRMAFPLMFVVTMPPILWHVSIKTRGA